MKLKTLDDKKIEILDKLADAGIDTEKKLTSLEMSDAFVVIQKSNIQIQDIHLISELQDAIKRRRFYSFLTGGADEKEVKRDGTAGIIEGNGAEEADDESHDNRDEGDGSKVDLGAPRLY